jgi:hypothetical protein
MLKVVKYALLAGAAYLVSTLAIKHVMEQIELSVVDAEEEEILDEEDEEKPPHAAIDPETAQIRQRLISPTEVGDLVAERTINYLVLDAIERELRPYTDTELSSIYKVGKVAGVIMYEAITRHANMVMLPDELVKQWLDLMDEESE